MSNFDSLNKARKMCKNLFWRELYSSLITCRLNVLQDFPEEHKFIPINGEPHITENKIAIQQDWSKSKTVGEILDSNGKFRDVNMILGDRKSLGFEYDELKKTLTDFVEVYSGGRLGVNGSRLARSNEYRGDYNTYGMIVTKKKKGCSYYYTLLNMNAKRDGWVNCGIKLEVDFTEEGIEWEYEEDEVLKIVIQVLKTPYLNRLKQFFIRLLRNNLFLGTKSQKNINSDPKRCFICGKHPKKRVPLF